MPAKAEPITEALNNFTMKLVGDLDDLRAGKITNADARVRAQLAREVLRSAGLQLQGMRFLSDAARTLPEQKRGKSK